MSIKGSFVFELIRELDNKLIGMVVEGPSETPYVVLELTEKGLRVQPLPYLTGMPKEGLFIPKTTKVTVPDQKTMISRYPRRYQNLTGKEIKEIGLLSHNFHLGKNGRET